jgi:hypothetical protein
MNTTRQTAFQYGIAIIAAASVIVGCNSGTGSLAGPSGTSSTIAQSQHGRGQAIVVTKVRVFDQNSATIVGDVVPEPCWTVSPSPLPTASPLDHTPNITETYDPMCTQSTGVTLQYTSLGVTCDFTTAWSSTGFVYSAMGFGQNVCSATPAPSGDNYDGKFTYGPILGSVARDSNRR